MHEPRLATLTCALPLLLLNRYNLIPLVIRENKVKPMLELLQPVFNGHTELGCTRRTATPLYVNANTANPKLTQRKTSSKSRPPHHERPPPLEPVELLYVAR